MDQDDFINIQSKKFVVMMNVGKELESKYCQFGWQFFCFLGIVKEKRLIEVLVLPTKDSHEQEEAEKTHKLSFCSHITFVSYPV